MKIAYAPYQLKSSSSLGLRKGTLLRFQFDTGIIGYSDLHPWPELGDLTLEDQLKRLRKGGKTPLLQRAIRHATLDGDARAEGRNLFVDLTLPTSHWLILSWSDAIPDGITCVKIKVGRDFSSDTRSLRDFINRYPDLSIRLDFNERLTVKDFEEFLYDIQNIRDVIDYIEDPFPFTCDKWMDLETKYCVHLAKDRGEGKYHRVVIKPASQDPGQYLDAEELTVTTSLDHPLGQATAAYYAGTLYERVNRCGLLSYSVYEVNDYSERFSRLNDVLLLPKDGTGFGFDDLLKKEKWIPL